MATVKQTVAQKEVMQAIGQPAAAWLVGRTPKFLRECDAPRNEDGSYNAKTLVAWMLERATATASDDPLLTGGDSPNLERYRKAKAELAEMDAAERRKQIVSLDELCDWWQLEIVPQFRAAVEDIDRISAAAGKVMLAAIEKASESIEQRRPEETCKPIA